MYDRDQRVLPYSCVDITHTVSAGPAGIRNFDLSENDGRETDIQMRKYIDHATSHAKKHSAIFENIVLYIVYMIIVRIFSGFTRCVHVLTIRYYDETIASQ